MNPDELFEDFELLIINAIANGSKQSKKEYLVFLAQVYAASRDFSLPEAKRSRARGKLVTLLGALQQLSIADVKKAVTAGQVPKKPTGHTAVVESQFDARMFMDNPYALLLYSDEFPLPLLLAIPHFAEVISITTGGERYEKKYFTTKKFSAVRCLFHPSLSLESQRNISATADPFTPLILIDPFVAIGDKDYRDHGSIVFDIVLQLTFIEEFKKCRGILDKELVRTRMYAAGASYAEDLFHSYLERGVSQGLIRYTVDDDTIAIELASQKTEAKNHAEYCLYLAESLFRGAQAEIERQGGKLEANAFWPQALSVTNVIL